MRRQYCECEYCGAALDPGERCDCDEAIKDAILNGIIKKKPE